MTYQSDPTRWTQSPSDAPELLRGAFDAGRREGPSERQMQALALKLAALGTGAAIAGSAAAAKASTATAGGFSAGGSAATGAAAGGGALSLGKIALSLALVGAAATGTVYLSRPEPAREAPSSLAAVAERAEKIEQAPSAQSEAAPTPKRTAPAARAERSARTPVQEQEAPPAMPVPAPAVELGDDDEVPPHEAGPSRHHRHRSERHRRTDEARSVSAPQQQLSTRRIVATTERGTAEPRESSAEASEIDLLRQARAVLAVRPREAFRLTEQHAELYPQGLFSQEREALAIEALWRAGELESARERARSFLRQNPTSPHAHRFRETMGLE